MEKDFVTAQATDLDDYSDASTPVFPKSEAKLEPLVCGWYAWIHLVSPIQHALNVINRHIPLLQSFIKNPSVHVAACADPKFFGGPFVDCPPSRMRDVQALLDETERRCQKLIVMAKDFKDVDRDCQSSATGYSLSEYYSRLPASLLGLVEFLYDVNCHPRLRFHEELLYDEDPAADTQEVMLSLVANEKRVFFMSTPRLRSPESVMLTMPFADRRLDRLSSMRTKPEVLATVFEEFQIDDDQKGAFRRLFTTSAPVRNRPDYSGSGVRVRYFGHACVLIQSASSSILLDPMLAWDSSNHDQRFTFADLPDKLDYVVISHNHQDHCSPEALIQLRNRTGCVIVPRNNSGNVADPSMKLALMRLGFRRIVCMDPFDEVSLADGKITSLPFPGEHVDLDIHSRHGILIEILGRRFAFLVDSDGRDSQLFRRVVGRIGNKVDALFVGMECHGAPLSWLYGPLLTKAISRRNDESRRLSGLDSHRATQVLQQFEPSKVFVYAMGQEPWLRYIMGLEYTADSVQLKEVRAFLAYCEQLNISAEQLFISREFEF